MLRQRTLGKSLVRALHALAIGLALALLFAPARASAYPWMIRHGYSACAPCHSDPSGAGPLTEYGRSAGGAVLSMQLDKESDEAPPTAGFLFGLVRPPEWLALGGDGREALLRVKVPGTAMIRETILMKADLEASITTGRFLASATGGYAHEGALGAAVTRGSTDNFVSRQHWLGYYVNEDSTLLLRAGRMNLPFGIRSIEHTLWVRALTQTDINDKQQYGAAFAWSAGPLRGELMAIAGNLQLRPDIYRERGYSTYLEAVLGRSLVLGASSLITHRELDPSSFKETWRQAHGAYVRYATPWEPLVVLSEWDYTLTSARGQLRSKGVAGYAQVDFEAAQGVHFLVTGEAQDVGVNRPPWSWGTWLSYAWFLLPHTDVRLDGIYQSLGSQYGRVPVYSLLLQGHVYL
ncbi:MAG TPA: hypothetical protein VHW01_30450 [Polyangiaceae bacterium]|jgi:hypothetical protein|nr:hypothetical protein [Polyangiaceae bacterium]